MAAVWKNSRQKGGHLLVLLALADWADESGVSINPTSLRTLAAKARLTERQVRRVLRDLETSGDIRTLVESDRAPRRYQILRPAGGDKMSGGEDMGVRTPVSARTYKPKTTDSPSGESATRGHAAVQAFVDEAERTGYATAARLMIGKVAGQVRRAEQARVESKLIIEAAEECARRRSLAPFSNVLADLEATGQVRGLRRDPASEKDEWGRQVQRLGDRRRGA